MDCWSQWSLSVHMIYSLCSSYYVENIVFALLVKVQIYKIQISFNMRFPILFRVGIVFSLAGNG